MRFQQAVRGHFFVREPFQGFGATPSDEDLTAIINAMIELNDSQATMQNAINSFLARCPGDTQFDAEVASSNADVDYIVAMKNTFAQNGTPEIDTIMSAINGHIIANEQRMVRCMNATCGGTVTADPWSITSSGGGGGGGSTGSGTTGGGGGGGGTMPVPPPPVQAGFGWWWLVGGALLGAMMLFSKNPPKLVAILGRKKTTRRKATRRTRTTRRAPRRRASRRRW